MGNKRPNLTAISLTGADKLFHSPAFVAGFSDQRAGRKFRGDILVDGPTRSYRSSQLAYERGRQFSILWGRQPFDIPKMIDDLTRWGPSGERIIT
jgi:hypothetical protein